MRDNKHLFKSKTFGVAIINVAALHLIPGAREFVSEYPEAYAELITVAMIALRLVSREAVCIVKKMNDGRSD